MSSLTLEQLALDQLFDERAHAQLASLCPRQDRLDLGAIGETGRRAGGEDRELSHEVSRHGLLILQEELLKFPNLLEGSSVGKLAGGIDREAPVELQLLPVHAVALDRRHVI